MVDVTPDNMAAKLLAEGFKRKSPDATAMSDPIVDTSMVVTLEQLQPYDLNPRITRNPLYEEIKASIHERGLDAPPAITRRPGAAHFVIRNGGNTRLAILRELWRETKEDRFFRIQCMFRPWPERGEIVALTGHLAENELHGGLTFIERALGIEKARELYELESAKALSQSELARRLAADGFPVSQPHISRMQEAVRYLLPAIPSVLYAGLGRPQVEKLVALRKVGMRVWEKRAADKRLTVDFPDLFQDVLASFDSAGETFSVKRVQDELVGQLADLLDASYDILMLELDERELWSRTLDRVPTLPTGPVSVPPPDPVAVRTPPMPPRNTETAPVTPVQDLAPMTETPSASFDEAKDEKLQAHTVSPVSSTDRLQEIQRMVAERTGEAMPDFASNVLQAIPVQVGGVYPISDIWLIAPALDAPEPLRIHIEQLAHEIAEEANLPEHIHACEDGIGYRCSGHPPEHPCTRAVFALLSALSLVDRQFGDGQGALSDTTLQDDLAPLLEGSSLPSASEESRLSDASLVKLFRLIRLARRLLDLGIGENQ